MPVPTTFSALSATAASNSPNQAEFKSVGDEYARQILAFLKSIYDNSGNGWAAPYLFTTAGVLSLPSAGAALDFTSTGATQAQINSYNTDALEIVTRSSAAVIRLYTGNGTLSVTFGAAGTWFKQTTTTVAGLTAAGTAGAGARSFVTDANATTFASVVAGGGSNGVPVYSDGTSWRIG